MHLSLYPFVINILYIGSNRIVPKVIEHNAFYACSRLVEVQFSDNLECIEDRAFGFCESIT
ncbi:MAG: leucine-rich repeat protein, partial [Bacteroidales bacterium]|nr:leucine-rich repeat protein [Bacteroidales bacterium]